MKFWRTSLNGVWLIELERREDERGFLARTYCEKEFAAQQLNTYWPQCNLTHMLQRGTIRGLHYQADPKPETKLVRCSAGAIYDVVVDLRANAPTCGRWEAFELTAKNRRQLYIPGGFGHGCQSLQENTEVFYQMSEFYDATLAGGIRWDDPTLGIGWPLPNPILSARDRNLPLLVARP